MKSNIIIHFLFFIQIILLFLNPAPSIADHQKDISSSNLKFAAIYDRNSSLESIAVHKDWPELTSIFDKVLSSLSEEEKLQIQKRWLPVSYMSKPGIAPKVVLKYILFVAGGALLILAVFLWWNYSLKKEISRRRQAEKSMQDSEARVSAVLNNVLDGIISISEDRIVETFNPAAEKIFGYKADEVIGNNVKMLQPEPYHSHHDEYVMNYLRTGKAKIIGSGREVRGLKKNGEVFPLDLAVTEMSIGKERKFVGIIRDITERKKADMLLREGEEKFRQLTDNINDVFWITSPDGSDMIYISPAFEKVWGIKPEAIYDNPILWMESIHPEDRKRVQQIFTFEKLTGGEFDTEFRVIHPDSTIRWIHAVGYPTYNEKGEVYRIAGIASDISNFKEIDQLKSMFIASMSHELRTPLNSIIGFIGIILQGMTGDITDEQKDMLNRSYGAAKHLLALISDVIDISKIEAGKIEPFAEEFFLAEVIAEASSNLKLDIEKKKLELELDVPPDIAMNTDRKRLLQCVLNFLSNAVKYSEKGKISITATEKGESVEVRFTDTGIGIKEDDLPRLFESFVRLDSHLKIATKGTGLGLYLTRKLASEVLNGTVSVTSTYAKGSTFILDIPKAI